MAAELRKGVPSGDKASGSLSGRRIGRGVRMEQSVLEGEWVQSRNLWH